MIIDVKYGGIRMKKLTRKRKLLLIIITILFIWAVVSQLSHVGIKKVDNKFIIKDSERPLLIAHGGGNKEFPDNTLEAFYNAYSIDPNVMLETDVSLTKDGIIILSHDTTLDRKTNLVNAPIIETNYADLLANEVDFAYDNEVFPKSNGFNISGEFIRYKNYLDQEVTPLDVTYPKGVTPRHNTKFLVTTLEELIKAFPNNIINVEIKQDGEIGLLALKKVIEIMDTLDQDYNTYDRIILASFHKTIYKKIIYLRKNYDNRLMYSPAISGVVKFFILYVLRLDLFYNDKITVLQIPPTQAGINLSRRTFIKAANRNNVAVHYWTVDDPDEMRRLVNNGADGIMTNLPSLLKEIYDEMEGSAKKRGSLSSYRN